MALLPALVFIAPFHHHIHAGRGIHRDDLTVGATAAAEAVDAAETVKVLLMFHTVA